MISGRINANGGEPTGQINPGGQSTARINPGEGEFTGEVKTNGEESTISTGAKPKATIAALKEDGSSAAGKNPQTVDSTVPTDPTATTATTVRL